MSRTNPPGVPLDLSLVARKTTYQLALGGRTLAEFRELVNRIESGNPLGPFKDFPPTPEVDLTLVIRNTGPGALTVALGGTNHSMLVQVSGPGALSFSPREAMLAMIFVPAEVPLGPGESYELPVRRLPMPELPVKTGQRFLAYWTEPGDYELTAVWQAGVCPAPAGTTDVGKGLGLVEVTSAPVTVRVEA